MYINKEHRKIVEDRNYIYIGSYDRKEVTIDNKNKSKNLYYIRVKCLYCNNEYDIQLNSFKRGMNCTHCCNKYENSFAYYIQQELGESLNKYWDWEKNIINPYLIYKNTHKKVWIKCTKISYHGSYKTQCKSFIKSHRCPYCASNKIHPKDSFAQWGIDTFGNDFIEKYWSNKNTINPFDISPNSTKKIWIKCIKTDYHGSYKIKCNHFTNGHRCPYCSHASGKVHPRDSFAQYHIEHTDKDFIEKYWSDKNMIDPFTIAPNSTKKVWIKCQEKDYHGDYLITCNSFTNENRCSYCHNRKIHKLDSFGTLYPEKAKYWSNRNKRSPYEVAPYTNQKYWFVCEDCGEEFETILSCITENKRSMKCKDCTSSKGEQKIDRWLTDNNISFIPQKKFEGLLGLGGRNLSYDFYLPDYNLLIEYQGIQHEKFTKGLQNSIYNFKKQQEHDKRKKEYAINNNIDLLEIWYYDYDNVEEILQQRLMN